MKDFDFCSGCGGMIEAGGDSQCTCDDAEYYIDPRDTFFTEREEE